MTVPTAPPGFAHYVASKAAVVGLTRALARELGDSGICVNTLTPDYIAFDREYDYGLAGTRLRVGVTPLCLMPPARIELAHAV